MPFEPQPSTGVPSVFPTPFRPGEPHPLAARAAQELQQLLGSHPWIQSEMFTGALGGKMMGVLVVRAPSGELGYLRGFAGMLGGRRNVEGFVPPLYDVPKYEALWHAGAPTITALDERIRELEARDALEPQQQERLDELRHEQRSFSQKLLPELRATYRIVNAQGESTPLDPLFVPHVPPGGAGDCAAPKLLGAAYEHGLHPIAVAEFWWGRSPPAGGRHHGVYYPACRGKCAKILPFMLQGIECEPAPDVGMLEVPPEAPRTVYEDDWVVVVDKPVGLLSVPGRGPKRKDSVEYRLQQRTGLDDPTWPRLAHRLDVATSGLLIAAKNKATYVALQEQFSRRRVKKRYTAVLAGRLPTEADEGVVELALRRDLDDRPRQMYDPRRGKAATTRWTVLAREAETTRVHLFPLTGRTHQLRLHAAHEAGLNTPILGDLLYGFGGERLMLHATELELTHPQTGETLRFESPCPF